jgi:hypothetical protein
MRVVVHLQGADQAQARFHFAAGADDVLTSGERDDSADWSIDAKPGEFWWPRAESLKEVLAPIPPRYTVVQALVREFNADGIRRRSVEEMKNVGTPVLRAVYRRGHERRHVPLRAWYPLEVLTIGTGEEGAVEDPRLRAALAGHAVFRTPDIVDDAAYAVECAEVGEVDLPRLEAYIAELEQRVAFLEQRLWPRLMRTASAIVRRR